jgi:hypothetical protein
LRAILLVPPPAELAPVRAALDDIAALYPLPRASSAAAAPASAPRRARTHAAPRPAAAVDIDRARRHLGRDAERQAARAARDFAAVLGNVHEVCMHHNAATGAASG